MVLKNLNKKVNFKKQALKNEIFFTVGSSLLDVGFSPKLTYFLLKRQFYGFYNLTKNTNSINLKVKMSRSRFKRANNLALLTGFYRAM
jgi:hypothetical protein